MKYLTAFVVIVAQSLACEVCVNDNLDAFFFFSPAGSHSGRRPCASYRTNQQREHSLPGC